MKDRRLSASTIAAAVLLAVPAVAQNGHRAGADSSFITKAAEGGMAEVQMAQLAQSKAGSQAVKDLANKLIADHTKANDELKPLAAKDNVTWPTGMSAKDQAEYNKLQAMSGADFDREYVNYEVKDHKQDISAFQREAEHGMDPDVKSWASQNLPALQKHLRLAQSAQSSIR